MMRQGDVLLIPVSAIPFSLKSSTPAKVVLAYGEVSGHHHRFESGNVTAFYKEGDADVGAQPIAGGGRLRGTATQVDFITVAKTSAPLVHEEHTAITVEPGSYRVVRQREFDMLAGVRSVVD